MNPKTVICIVLVAVLAAAVCSASRSSNKPMPYQQLLRELQKRGSSRMFDESENVRSKRTEMCGIVGRPCSDSEVGERCVYPNTCGGLDLACYSGTDTCEPDYANQYRR